MKGIAFCMICLHVAVSYGHIITLGPGESDCLYQVRSVNMCWYRMLVPLLPRGHPTCPWIWNRCFVTLILIIASILNVPWGLYLSLSISVVRTPANPSPATIVISVSSTLCKQNSTGINFTRSHQRFSTSNVIECYGELISEIHIFHTFSSVRAMSGSPKLFPRVNLLIPWLMEFLRLCIQISHNLHRAVATIHQYM